MVTSARSHHRAQAFDPLLARSFARNGTSSDDELLERVDHALHQRRHAAAHRLHAVELVGQRRELAFLRGDQVAHLPVVRVDRLDLLPRRAVLREQVVRVVGERIDALLRLLRGGVPLAALADHLLERLALGRRRVVLPVRPLPSPTRVPVHPGRREPRTPTSADP